MAPPVENSDASTAAKKGDVDSGTQYLETHKSSSEVQNSVEELNCSNKYSYHEVMTGICNKVSRDAGKDASLDALLPKIQLADSKTSDAINPQSVRQGDVGDCFFEASLSSLANTKEGQDNIKNMVKNNNDGSYTVTFPGDTQHPITVCEQEISNLKNTGDLRNTSPTMEIVETAFQKYDRCGVYGEGINAWANEQSGQKTSPLLQIHDAGSALHLLTGKDTTTEGIGFADVSGELGLANKANVERFIQSALAKGEPVVAASNLASNAAGNIFGTEPIAARHEYSILGYDPKTQTVTLRNPWGHNDGTVLGPEGSTTDAVKSLGYGQIQMSLDTFMRDFNAVSAAGVKPTENRLSELSNDANTLFSDASGRFVDVLNGKFSNGLNDAGKVLNEQLNLGTDIFTTTVNSAKSAAGTVVRNTYNTISDTVKKINNAMPWNF